jgi:hypothetical protein
MTFGRPTTIPRTWHTDVPSLIDDEYLSTTGHGEQPPSSPSRMGLFVYSAILFDILDDVLSSFYVQDMGKLQPRNYEIRHWSPERSMEVFKLNTKLDHFMTTLPDYLQPADTSASFCQNSDSYITLQMRVLNCRFVLLVVILPSYAESLTCAIIRFLYIRILLLRPVILATVQDSIGTAIPSESRTSDLALDVSKAMCNLCVRTAHELIFRLNENLDNNYRSTAWHTVYC